MSGMRRSDFRMRARTRSTGMSPDPGRLRTGSPEIMFTADHGEFHGAHRLNDKGPAMYEDIYRIPAILSAPGGKSRRELKFISLQDFTATFIDIAGEDASGVRGESLMPATQGPLPSGWRTQIVCEFHGHHFPYAQRMIRTEHHKYLANPEGIDEFYDLAADPDELLNVISVPAYKGKVADLRLRLYRELIARGDKFYQRLAFAGDISLRTACGLKQPSNASFRVPNLQVHCKTSHPTRVGPMQVDREVRLHADDVRTLGR